MTLITLQQQVLKGWTALGYSPEFRGRKSSYKHLDHALKHVRKAIQKIENMTEEADHLGTHEFPKVEVELALADAVISLARAANIFPVRGPIDLGIAVEKRLSQKMTPAKGKGKGKA
jgi:hypothetical protein